MSLLIVDRFELTPEAADNDASGENCWVEVGRAKGPVVNLIAASSRSGKACVIPGCNTVSVKIMTRYLTCLSLMGFGSLSGGMLKMTCPELLARCHSMVWRFFRGGKVLGAVSTFELA